MQQLLIFLSKRKHFFLFLFIQLITLWLTFQNQDYHRSKFVNSAGNITGYVFTLTNNWNQYLGLKEENQILLEENAKLRSLLENSMFEISKEFTEIRDTNILGVEQKYNYTSAEIINNSFRNRNNYITINKGLEHGIIKESGVICSKGIVGVIESVGQKYSSVISILNKNLPVNAQLKNSQYFGSLSWPGESRNKFILSDVPKQAKIAIGDTIVTGGYSGIFPEGILIGKVIKAEVPEGQNYHEIEVESFFDYANLKSVYIIQNLHKEDLNTIANE